VRMASARETLHTPDASLGDITTAGDLALFITTGGDGLLAKLTRLELVLRQPLCHGAVHDLRFLAGQQLAAYSCDEGTVGIWDLARRTVTARMHLDGRAKLLVASAEGDYLVAAGGNGVLAMLDRSTDLITYYRGQEFRLTTLVAPTLDYRYVLSGDVRGGIRAWPLQTRFARVVANLHQRFVATFFNRQTGSIVAPAYRKPSLVMFSPTGTGEIQNIEPHLATAAIIRQAQNGERFATYGLDNLVELWSSATMTRSTVFDTHHGAVWQVALEAGTDEIFTSGEDGNLVRWTPAGKSHVVAQFGQPVIEFALASTTRIAVVGTGDGALWRVAEDGRVTSLRVGRAKPLTMRTLPDGISICVGYANGEVVIVDTRSGLQARLLQAADAIQDIVITPDGRAIAVAANDGTVRIGSRRGDSWLAAGATWVSLSARARRLAITSDGLLVAICTDGSIWLYSVDRGAWLYVPTGTSDLSLVMVASDGKTGVTFDADGRIILMDLQRIRSTISSALGAH